MNRKDAKKLKRVENRIKLIEKEIMRNIKLENKGIVRQLEDYLTVLDRQREYLEAKVEG